MIEHSYTINSKDIWRMLNAACTCDLKCDVLIRTAALLTLSWTIFVGELSWTSESMMCAVCD